MSDASVWCLRPAREAQGALLQTVWASLACHGPDGTKDDTPASNESRRLRPIVLVSMADDVHGYIQEVSVDGPTSPMTSYAQPQVHHDLCQCLLTCMVHLNTRAIRTEEPIRQPSRACPCQLHRRGMVRLPLLRAICFDDRVPRRGRDGVGCRADAGRAGPAAGPCQDLHDC